MVWFILFFTVFNYVLGRSAPRIRIIWILPVSTYGLYRAYTIYAEIRQYSGQPFWPDMTSASDQLLVSLTLLLMLFCLLPLVSYSFAAEIRRHNLVQRARPLRIKVPIPQKSPLPLYFFHCVAVGMLTVPLSLILILTMGSGDISGAVLLSCLMMNVAAAVAPLFRFKGFARHYGSNITLFIATMIAVIIGTFVSGWVVMNVMWQPYMDTFLSPEASKLFGPIVMAPILMLVVVLDTRLKNRFDY